MKTPFYLGKRKEFEVTHPPTSTTYAQAPNDNRKVFKTTVVQVCRKIAGSKLKWRIDKLRSK